MLPCTWQIHRLWCMKSEFGLNSKIGCITGLVICDTCAHLLSSDDKWKWIGVWEIARVQRFILGVAKREQAMQRLEPLWQIPLLFLAYKQHLYVDIKDALYRDCVYKYQLISLIWTSFMLRLYASKQTKPAALKHTFWHSEVCRVELACFNDAGNAAPNKHTEPPQERQPSLSFTGLCLSVCPRVPNWTDAWLKCGMTRIAPPLVDYRWVYT